VGGGKLARNYQEAAKKNVSNNELDWLGIKATKFNAKKVKDLFKKYSQKEIIDDPTKKIYSNEKIILAGGWKPGWSTDYDAILLAKNFKVNKVINMSNIDYVYDKDPRKNKNARKIKYICWKHYRKIAGNEWTAGLNLPFDPIASKEAQKSKIEVIVIGNSLKNFENLLNNKIFNGTIIK